METNLQGFSNAVANPQGSMGGITYSKGKYGPIRVFNPIYFIGWMDEFRRTATLPWVKILTTKPLLDKPNTNRQSSKTPVISKRHELDSRERQRHAACFKSKR